jgi:hypothetical protein
MSRPRSRTMASSSLPSGMAASAVASAPTADDFFDDQASDTSAPEAGKAGNVVVVCRVRPFGRREIELQDDMNAAIANDWEKQPLRSVVDMEGGDTVFLDHTNHYSERQRFPFDISFWSVPPEQQQAGKNPVADQTDVYRQVGLPIIRNIWQGYNSCIFAYGQTGSGKTFTMMGTATEPGLIPRVCKGLFETIERRRDDDAREAAAGDGSVIKEMRLEARFFEIYNEKVKDLLWALRTPSDEDAGIDRENIRVRHSGSEISLVGLTCVDVADADDCLRLIEEGTRNRSVGATKMNDQSSRSHSIFRLTFVQTTRVLAKDKFEKPKVYNRTSTVSLVDLAGSERMKKTGAEGQRLKEAVAINQSLTTLKNVIDALVEGRSVVPYRDSTLTWILSDNLGGNSKTFMIACVSPHLDNADETLNTLRYALRTQAIVCHATVNESDELKRMNRMKDELERLQREYADGAGDSEYVALKARQDDLTAATARAREVADEAVREENASRRALEVARRHRFVAAYRGAFHRVFLKRADLAYTAFFARDAATLAGLKREVDSYAQDVAATDKELSDLRAEERRTLSALKNSEAERARQRDRMESVQASLRDLDRMEARNQEQITDRQAKLPRAAIVGKQIVQRKLISISVERERAVRANAAELDRCREEHAAEIEALRQERARRLEPVTRVEEELAAQMTRDDAEHVANMAALKERLTALQSSCVFVENENRRSATEVDDAILRGNKDRFESFAAAETESKKRLQEFSLQSKAALTSQLERMRVDLAEGQSRHDRAIDRVHDKARDDVLRISRDAEAAVTAHNDDMRSRLQRFESLSADAAGVIRAARAAQRRYSDLHSGIMLVLAGADPPEIARVDEMDAIERLVRCLQAALGLGATGSTSASRAPAGVAGGAGSQSRQPSGARGGLDSPRASQPNAASPALQPQHQSVVPLVFRTNVASSSLGNATPRAGGGGGGGAATSRSSSHTPSHTVVAAPNATTARAAATFASERGATTPRGVRFADPLSLSGSSLARPAAAGASAAAVPPALAASSPTATSPGSTLSPSASGTPVAALLRRPPPVYQTSTSALRAAYARHDRRVAAVQRQRDDEHNGSFTPRIGLSPGSRNASSSRARSPNPAANEPAWNATSNYYGYVARASNVEPILYANRVVVDGHAIAMRARPPSKSPRRGASQQ